MDAYSLCSLYEASHYLFLCTSWCQRRLRCWAGVERDRFVCTSERRGRKSFNLYTLRNRNRKKNIKKRRPYGRSAYVLDCIMQFYNPVWILMNFLKSVHCRYQKHSSWWWLHKRRLRNKARWRAFTLLLSFYPSTTRHTFTTTIVFKHTVQPSSLVGRYGIGSHSFPSYNSLLVSEDTDGKMLSRVITKKNKGSFIYFCIDERGVNIFLFLLNKKRHPPPSDWIHMFPFIHIYVCTSHISATPG